MKSLIDTTTTARPGRMSRAIDRVDVPHVGECDGAASWRELAPAGGRITDTQRGHAAFRERRGR